MPPKSIWRGPDVQHFQVVHRSQRDPLINDAEAGAHVLKAVGPRQRGAAAGNGKTRADLEAELGATATSLRGNVGEAAKYGVYYDDTEYDYMQHLRPIGGAYNASRGGVDEPVGADVVMLPAPSAGSAKPSKPSAPGAGARSGFELKDGSAVPGGIQLPDEVLPSKKMLPRDWTRGEDVQEGLRGLQPDMNPHLRQVLEALDDDAFLLSTAKRSRTSAAADDEAAARAAQEAQEEEEEDEDEEDLDDFFSGITAGGALEEGEEPEWKDLPPEGDESINEDPATRAARELLDLKANGKGAESLSLEARVALFKAAQNKVSAVQGVDLTGLRTKRAGLDDDATSTAGTRRAPSSVGSQSIFGEKGPSRRSRHPGAKARLAATYYAPSAMGGATAFSMSSSAMERNAGLSGLDEQFDKMESLYEQDSDEEDDDEDEEDPTSRNAEIEAMSREDFDNILDEFLDKHEVYGGKLKDRLGGRESSGASKLGLLRKGLGAPIIRTKAEDEESSEEDEPPMPRRAGEDREKWDVETVLSTRSNLENHPRLISAKSSVASTTSYRPATIASSGAGRSGGWPEGSETSDMIPRIKINPRTGFPEITAYIKVGKKRRGQKNDDEEAEEAARNLPALDDDDGSGPPGALGEEDASDAESDMTEGPRNVTVTRPRNESAEEKKARKAALKESKQSRREEKSARKAAFSRERKTQIKVATSRVAGGGAADVGRNGVGTAGTAIRLS